MIRLPQLPRVRGLFTFRELPLLGRLFTPRYRPGPALRNLSARRSPYVLPTRAIGRRGLTTVLLALVVAATSACGDATGPDGDRLKIEVPEVFRSVHDLIETCSLLEGDFDGISWYVTSGFPDAPSVLGRWNSRREITLRLDTWLETTVVAHEILHDLLRGDPRHQSNTWSLCNLPTGVDGAK